MSGKDVALLWFGDERGYNATTISKSRVNTRLWFGDERGYNATHHRYLIEAPSCGLVMKEDITQRFASGFASQPGCGLVMKEDITQPVRGQTKFLSVVVW